MATTLRGLSIPPDPVDALTIPDIIYKKTDKYVKVGYGLNWTGWAILIINAILWLYRFTLGFYKVSGWEIPNFITGTLGFINAILAIANYFYTYKDYIGLKDRLDEYILAEFSYRQLHEEDGSKIYSENQLKIDRIIIYKYIERKNLFKMSDVFINPLP